MLQRTSTGRKNPLIEDTKPATKRLAEITITPSNVTILHAMINIFIVIKFFLYYWAA